MKLIKNNQKSVPQLIVLCWNYQKVIKNNKEEKVKRMKMKEDLLEEKVKRTKMKENLLEEKLKRTKRIAANKKERDLNVMVITKMRRNQEKCPNQVQEEI